MKNTEYFNGIFVINTVPCNFERWQESQAASYQPGKQDRGTRGPDKPHETPPGRELRK